MTAPDLTNSSQPAQVVPAKSKKKKRLIIGIIVAAVVIIGGIGGIVASRTSTASASVGSCIKVTSPTLKPLQSSQEDCSSTAAIYLVSETGDSSVTCDPAEMSFTDGSSVTICVRENLTVGQCLNPGDGTTVPAKVDCANPGSATALKLVALLTDSSDKAKCPEETKGAVAFVKRNIVYCYAAAA